MLLRQRRPPGSVPASQAPVDPFNTYMYDVMCVHSSEEARQGLPAACPASNDEQSSEEVLWGLPRALLLVGMKQQNSVDNPPMAATAAVPPDRCNTGMLQLESISIRGAGPAAAAAIESTAGLQVAEVSSLCVCEIVSTT